MTKPWQRTVGLCLVLGLALLGARQTGQSLPPGRYCYRAADDTTAIHVRLRVAPSGDVKGETTAVIQNVEEGYFTSYRQDVEGKLDGQYLTVEVTTAIEDDVQRSSENWLLRPGRLVTDQAVMGPMECEAVDAIFAGEPEPDPFAVQEPDADEFPVHRYRVTFEPGQASTSYSSGVVRGERDEYQLFAHAGQELTLWIDSIEDNAVFDLLAPDGTALASESIRVTAQLPVTGMYRIIVGGTRGNTSYELVVAVR